MSRLVFALFLLGSSSLFAGRGRWTPLTSLSTPTPFPIGVIAVSPAQPEIVLAGELSGGLFRSGDGGSTWQAASINSSCSLRDVRFSPNTLGLDPGAYGPVYAVCGDFSFDPAMNFSALYSSSDSGSTWAALRTVAGIGSTRLGFAKNTLFVVDQSFVDLHPPVFSSALAVSTDPPGLWTEAPINAGYVNDLAVIASDPAVILASWYSYAFPVPPEHGGVQRSADGGLTWQGASGLPDAPTGSIGADPFDAAHALVAAGMLLYESRDTGAHWSPLGTEFSSGISVVLFDAEVPGRVYAATPGEGVFVSSDGGKTWTAINDGLSDLNVSSLAISGSRLLAGTNSGSLFSIDFIRVRPVTAHIPGLFGH